MSRLEEIKESMEILDMAVNDDEIRMNGAELLGWYLSDLSETLAMIYDKLCEKTEGNDDT